MRPASSEIAGFLHLGRTPQGKANGVTQVANAGAFKKGEKRPKQGRPPGTPNKSTVEFRDTVRKLLDTNAENVGRWLTLVAEGDGSENGRPDPGKALDLLAKLAEFAAPKLNRTELTGDPDAPVQSVTRIELVALGSRTG